MKEARAIWIIILSTAFIVLAFAFYQRAEDRKAYYACLQLSEKVLEQQKQDNRAYVTSLPYCRN